MTKAKKTPKPAAPVTATPTVVAAVAVSASSLEDAALAQRVEAAMSQAVLDCLAQGISITDSPAIKAAIRAARQRVRTAAGLPED